jgi:GntR family transcriptional regulator
VSVDPRSDRPIYRQVADILRDQITNGTLAPGAMLPSEKQLADTYGIGRDAVRQAITSLRTEGLVVTRRGERATVRVYGPRRAVALDAGTTAIARMPTEAERAALALEHGSPVIVVSSVDGTPTLYPADSTVLISPKT